MSQLPLHSKSLLSQIDGKCFEEDEKDKPLLFMHNIKVKVNKHLPRGVIGVLQDDHIPENRVVIVDSEVLRPPHIDNPIEPPLIRDRLLDFS